MQLENFVDLHFCGEPDAIKVRKLLSNASGWVIRNSNVTIKMAISKNLGNTSIIYSRIYSFKISYFSCKK